MLKVGIFGVGYMGKIHIRLLQELSNTFEIIGFFDPSDSAAKAVEDQFVLKRYIDQDLLIESCDCIDIVAPTIHHFEIAVKAIKNSKHVFIEKPVTQTVEEAKTLMLLAEEASVHVQVGHVERFNQAFITALPYIQRPMFIEVHRLAQYKSRGTDVSVVLDLMIHDLDIILSVVKSNIKRVAATGIAVFSDTPDIANARIEFDNGCVANLTASRISQFSKRKSDFFQRKSCVSVNFMDKEVEVVHQNEEILSENSPHFDHGNSTVSKKITIEKPCVIATNAIQEELFAFAHAIQTNTIPLVSIEDAFRSMELATQIMDRLKVNGSSNNDNI